MTLTLRNKAVSESNARFGNLSRAIHRAFPLVEGKVGILLVNEESKESDKDSSRGRLGRYRASLGLPPGTLPVTTSQPIAGPGFYRRYTFTRSPETVAEFDAWIKTQIEAEILQPTIPLEQKWLTSKLGIAYSRGATQSRNIAKPVARRLGRELPDSSPYLNKAHLDRARLIFTRNFDGMEGITDSMKFEMRRVLSDGILRGENPKEISLKLIKRVDIGRARANRIARTEIIEAHQEASLLETEILEAELGVIFDMEWLTTKDGRQRDSHNARDGKIYSKAVAQSMIGEPNCRCAIFPHIDLSKIGKINRK